MSLHRHHESQVWEYGGVAYVLATLNIICSVANSNSTFFFAELRKSIATVTQSTTNLGELV